MKEIIYFIKEKCDSLPVDSKEIKVINWTEGSPFKGKIYDQNFCMGDLVEGTELSFVSVRFEWENCKLYPLLFRIQQIGIEWISEERAFMKIEELSQKIATVVEMNLKMKKGYVKVHPFMGGIPLIASDYLDRYCRFNTLYKVNVVLEATHP